MMKKVIGALTLSSAVLALGFVGANPANAEEVKEGDNTYYVVESGDTLSKIAEAYGTQFTVVHANNETEIDHADLIFAGQKLLVAGVDFDANKDVQYQATVVETQPVTVADTTYVEDTTVYYDGAQAEISYVAPTGGDDNWHRANRRMVETTNNYQWYWSNGYLGAYQFAQSTWDSIASKYGLDPNDHSPANQDAMADAYANDRYGGWSNVPTTGGW